MKIEAQVVPMYENVPSWGELLNHLYKINYMTSSDLSASYI